MFVHVCLSGYIFIDLLKMIGTSDVIFSIRYVTMPVKFDKHCHCHKELVTCMKYLKRKSL